MHFSRLIALRLGTWVIVIAATLIVGCSKSSDEEQVYAVIEAAEAAAEARDTSAVMDLVAADFKEARGLDKEDLRAYLRAYFLTHPKIELLVHAGPIEFETATRARVSIEVVMVGRQRVSDGESGSLTGESESLRVELQRRQSQWRVTLVEPIRKQ